MAHIIRAGIYDPDTNRRVEPAVARCIDCGAEVELWDAFTNTCDGCGQEYNGAGQALRAREQWGWETGETAADILAPGDAFEDW